MKNTVINKVILGLSLVTGLVISVCICMYHENSIYMVLLAPLTFAIHELLNIVLGVMYKL